MACKLFFKCIVKSEFDSEEFLFWGLVQVLVEYMTDMTELWFPSLVMIVIMTITKTDFLEGDFTNLCDILFVW